MSTFLNTTKPNVPYLIMEIVIVIVATLGNLDVLISFYRMKSLRIYSNYFIASLACADLLLSTIAQPIYILWSLGYPRILYACLGTITIVGFISVCSMFSYVLITADRFWAISSPYSYQKKMKTSKIVGRMIFCAWFLSAILAIPPLLGLYNHDGWDPSKSHCFLRQILGAYRFYAVSTIVNASLVLMLLAYVYMYIVIRRLRNKCPPMIADAEFDTQSIDEQITCHIIGMKFRSDALLAMRLGKIVIVFLICQVPMATTYVITVTCPKCEVPPELYPFVYVLNHAHAAINPFLYAYHLPEFRDAMKISSIHRCCSSFILK